jgi:hypothetical protein
MTGEIEALERATARLSECDSTHLAEMAEAAAERAEAIAGLKGRVLEESDADRVRAVIEAGDAVMTRVREWSSEWREDLHQTDQAQRYAAELAHTTEPARGQIDLAG